MELIHGIGIIAIITACISLFIILAGCNTVHPEFDFIGNGADSIQKQCENYNEPRQYQKCVGKAIDKEFACANWFFWLRY